MGRSKKSSSGLVQRNGGVQRRCCAGRLWWLRLRKPPAAAEIDKRGGVGGVADFGSVPVGTSKLLYVFLGNGQIGPETYETLRGIGIAVEGPDLSFDSACPADSLPQANVCSINLTWTPSAAYVLAGRVRVISNAPSSPTTLALSGTAVR